MFSFIEFILRDISREDLEAKGWEGVLKEYSDWIGGKEDFKRMTMDLAKFIAEKFREG